MVTTPEARWNHWWRCINGQPKWPFHTPSRCTAPTSIKALHEHLANVHQIPPAYLTGWYPAILTWERLLSRHELDHDRDGWATHTHAEIPDTSWD